MRWRIDAGGQPNGANRCSTWLSPAEKKVRALPRAEGTRTSSRDLPPSPQVLFGNVFRGILGDVRMMMRFSLVHARFRLVSALVRLRGHGRFGLIAELLRLFSGRLRTLLHRGAYLSKARRREREGQHG